MSETTLKRYPADQPNAYFRAWQRSLEKAERQHAVNLAVAELLASPDCAGIDKLRTAWEAFEGGE